MSYRLVLPSLHRNHLLALPETGMGYQRVVITLKSGVRVSEVVVENAMYANIPDGVPIFTVADILSIEPESNPTAWDSGLC